MVIINKFDAKKKKDNLSTIDSDKDFPSANTNYTHIAQACLENATLTACVETDSALNHISSNYEQAFINSLQQLSEISQLLKVFLGNAQTSQQVDNNDHSNRRAEYYTSHAFNGIAAQSTCQCC